MRHPRRFRLQVGGAVVLFLVLLSGFQMWRVTSGLAQARDQAKPLQQALLKGDVRSARLNLKAFNAGTTRAHHATDGPGWWLVSHVPLIGRNFDALRVVSREADVVSDEALPRIVTVADQVQLETFRPRNGRVNLAAVKRTVPVLKTTDRVLDRADRHIAAIDIDGLLGPLRAPIGEVQAQTHRVAVGASAAADVGTLMPGMLGDDGVTRTYLMLVLNNAEARSLGGIPGSVAVISAKDGRLKMGRQGSITDMVSSLTKKPVAPVKPELRAGFLSTVAVDMRDAASIPDFPRAAQLIAAIVGRQWNLKFDGVVSVDPVSLSYALGGLGAVDIGDNTQIDSTNAVSTLLHGIYLKYSDSNQQQDDAFKAAARQSFDALTSGRGNSVATIRGLVRGVRERRIMLWSKDAAEQRRVRTGGISGALAPKGPVPEVGAFLNDGGSYKMSYYLHMATRVDSQKCFLHGVQTFTLTATIRSDAPQDAKRLPIVVAGNGTYVRPGEDRFNAMIAGPAGGRILQMEVDGRSAPIGANSYMGRPITRIARVLPPGETTVISIDMVTGENSPGEPVIVATPGAGPIEMAVNAKACPAE